jgi:hypothetical protein
MKTQRIRGKDVRVVDRQVHLRRRHRLMSAYGVVPLVAHRTDYAVLSMMVVARGRADFSGMSRIAAAATNGAEP